MGAIVEKDIYLRLKGNRSRKFIGKKTKGVFRIKELETIIYSHFKLEPALYVLHYARSGLRNVLIRTQQDLDLALEGDGTESTFLNVTLCGRCGLAIQVLVALAKQKADSEMAATVQLNLPNANTPLAVRESVESPVPTFEAQFNALQGRGLSAEPSSSQDTGAQKCEISSTSSTYSFLN